MTGRDLGPYVEGTPLEAAAQADRADTYAVVVGIDRYPAYGNLQGARNDARRFHEWLIDPAGGGVPQSNARLHISGKARTVRGARPLKRDIDRELDEFVGLARAASRPTRLYLFFAGHGIAPAQSTGAGVMANAVPKHCWNISFCTYLTWFERCRDFSEVVLLSDCCRLLADAKAGAPQHDVCAGGPHPRQSKLVAHATDIDRWAYEAPARGGPVRGYFTSALLDGLRGGAADPRSGEVDATSLAAFLDEQVRERSGDRQYPRIDHSYPPLVLARPCAPEATFEVTVLVPEGPQRSVRIGNGEARDVVAVVTAGAPFTVSLVNGLYELGDPQRSDPLRFAVDGRPITVDGR